MKPVQNVFVRYRVINRVAYLGLNNELYELDEIGQFIWESLDGQKDIEQISEAISNKYNVDIEIVKKDVQDFVKQLIDNGLAEV